MRAHMLRPELQHVAPALCGVEQQRERQPGLRADGMMRLKGGDLVLGPRMMTGGGRHLGLDAERRIIAIGDHAATVCVGHPRARWISPASGFSRKREKC